MLHAHKTMPFAPIGWRRNGDPIWPVMGGDGTTDAPADGGGQPADDAAKPADKPAEDTAKGALSQADVDRIVADRLARERAATVKKYGDLEALKAKASEHDKLVEATRSEAEKATAAAVKAAEEKVRAEFEPKLSQRELASTRLEVALLKGLPEDVAKRVVSAAKRLVGSSREELEADAAEFFAATGPLQPKSSLKPDLSQGGKGEVKPSVASGRDLWAQRHPSKTKT